MAKKDNQNQQEPPSQATAPEPPKKTVVGIWEKADRWITGLMAIPVFGMLIRSIFESFTEAGVKEVKKALGTDTAAAAKDPEDEILYGAVLNKLTQSEKKAIQEFEIQLRTTNAKRAEAFVLWVAKIVKAFERETKGSTDPKKETVIRDISAGIEQAKTFIQDVLLQKKGSKEKTFAARVAFLEGKNAFSLISTKTPSWILQNKGKVLALIFVIPLVVFALSLFFLNLFFG